MKPSLRIGNVVIAALLVLGIALAVPGQAAVQAGPNNIRLSQVYGGGGNSGATLTNDFIELYNPTSTAISLSDWSVQYASATGSTWQVTSLSGSIPANGYYLIKESQGSGGSTPLPTPDATGNIFMSATNGKVALVSSTVPLTGTCPSGVEDFVGFGSTANCSEGGVPTSTLSNTTAALRNNNGCVDTDSNSADFTVGTPAPRNSASTTFVCPADNAPTVASTTPANGANNVALTADISVTFSEPVDVTEGWFELSCDSSGTHTTVVTGGSTTFTINPDADFTNETCTLTVLSSNVTDQDADDPPDNMANNFTVTFSVGEVCLATYTPVFAIQGSGLTAAITGTVTTQGVVVGDYEGGNSPQIRGFYLQSVTGDSDPVTSDGIFIYNGSNNNVDLGDVVRVTGNASEYQGQTQISASSIVACGTDSVEPTDVEFPVPNTTFLEQYEGMLVRLPQTMYVTEHFQLGRFGQVVISAGARLQQPTNVVAPGADANALQAANNLNKIILDDASQAQNPDPILFARGGLPLSASNTLRGGDTATGIVGVLNYTWAGNSASGNAYRVRPINALYGHVNFEAVNLRPETPGDVSGTLEAGALNLLNYFNTFDGLPDTVNNCTNGVGGAATDCRGADTQAEFDRQWPKTVAAILGMNVDVLGIVEIENDGYGADSAIQHLVDQLNTAAGPGTYAFIDVDAATGQLNALGTDAIKVGLIYKPAMVTPVGVTAALNSVAFVNGGDGAPRTRPALAQTFQQNSNGARFTVVVNHFKSKGSACDVPDAGDGQGNCNLVRVNAATELANWLASDPTLTSESDILILGDLNSYAMEDPITALKDAGYTNLLDLFLGPEAYSYVFDGQWGYLDHALATGSLWPQVTGISEFHINADEPSVLDYNTDFKTPNLQTVLYAPDMFRVSDHDPVIVGLDLQNSPYPSDLGFVNGSGWVPAPEGSYHADPAWSGKAQFAIDVKYHKDAVVPEGSFSLVLEKAGFEFFSSNVEWLTVSQDGKYAVFTGFGSANTIDGYRYIVWLQIGKPDYIRFQIWDGTQLVFDNGPLQRLSGNISIHQ